MKLLLVTNLFPTPYDPERGVFTLQLAKRLQKHCKVTVICPLPWFPNFKFLHSVNKWLQYSQVPEKYEIEGISVYSPKYFVIPKLSENFHASLMSHGIFSCIKKLHCKEKFDAINSQWFYPDSVAVDKIIKTLNIPHIPTGLGSDINREMQSPVKHKMIINMLQNSDAITVVSNNLKKELINHGIDNKKVSVIPNGIDTEKFKILNKKECRKRLNLTLEHPMILYVGRLSEEKSITTLIKAMHHLKTNNTSVTAYILGEGRLLDDLQSETITLGLEDNIHFIGKVEHDEVGTWMGATDYLCLPSVMEGCPNVILEALGSGRPVIASTVGAIPDIVTDQSGILFTPENVSELSNAINQAIDKEWNEDEILKSVELLSWEHAAENYYNVFKSIITQ